MLAQEFWEYQKIEKTDEEMQYENLCKQLDSMIQDYTAQLNDLELDLRSKIKQVESPAEIDDQLESLKLIYQNLLDLQESMERVGIQ